MINTNLPPILQRFGVIAFDMSEPAGLCHRPTGSKLPGGMTLIPWKASTPVVWCGTWHQLVLQLRLTLISPPAKLQLRGRRPNYSNLSPQQTFYPIAVETLGQLNEDARLLLNDLGRRISAVSGDLRKVFFVLENFCCCAAVLLHNGFVKDDQPE